MEYAVPPANAVTSKKSTVSHTWMLRLRRKLVLRPSKIRSNKGQNERRSSFRPAFLKRQPLRFSEKKRPLAEDIPDTPGGVDKLGVPGVALDLFAQVADVHVDRTLIAELVAPYPCEQSAAREHPARVGCERHQELELCIRQVHVFAADRDPATGQVDLQAVIVELVLALPRRHRRPTHNRANPRHELPHREWLCNVVVRPELQPHDPVDLVVLRREHNDRNVALRSNPATHLRTVYLGQHNIQDDQVRLVGFESL